MYQGAKVSGYLSVTRKKGNVYTELKLSATG